MIELISKKEAIERLSSKGVNEKFWENYIAGKVPKIGRKFNYEDIEVHLESLLEKDRKKIRRKYGSVSKKTKGDKKCNDIRIKSQKSNTTKRVPAGMSMRDTLVHA